MKNNRYLWILLLFILVLSGLEGAGWSQTLSDYYIQGLKSYNRSDFKGALKSWKQGLEIAEKMENRYAIGAFLTNIGLVHDDLDDYAQALSYYQQALKIKREIGDRNGVGDNLHYIGIVHRKLGDYPKALSYYEQALKIKREIGDRKGVGDHLSNLGVFHGKLGDYPKALSYCEQALKIKWEIGDRKGVGDNLTNLGIVHWNLGDYPKALSYYEQSLKIKREIGDRNGVGDNLTNIGAVHLNLGDYPKALSYYEQSLKIKREIGDRNGVGDNLTNLGIVHRRLGDYPKALSYFEQALKIAREIGDRKGVGGNFTNFGLFYSDLGDYSKALSYYEQALKIAREIGDRKGVGGILNNLGLVYRNLGDCSKALSYYEQSLRIYREIGVSQIIRITEANMGDVHLEQGNIQQALGIFQQLDAPVRLGRYYLRVRDFQRAKEEFARSLKRDEAHRNADFLVADYIGLGLSYEGLGSYPEATQYYRKAINFIKHQRVSLTEPLRRRFFSAKVMGFSRLEPYEGLVRVSLKLNDIDEGFFWAENTRSRVLLEAIANRPAGETLGIQEDLSRKETRLINHIATTYKQMEIAFKKKNLTRQKELEQELTELKQERQSFVELLRKEYPVYASVRYPEPIRIEDLRLQPDEVIVEYEVTENETFGWLIRSGKVIKSIVIPISRQNLTDQVKHYRNFFEKITSYSQLLQYDPKVGKKLYDQLLGELATFIKAGERLIVIPDEILGILPFEALVVELPSKEKSRTGKFGPYPQEVQYLGDFYPISYYQSATAFAIARTLKIADAAKVEKMLVVADPVFEVSDARLTGKMTMLAQQDDYQIRLMRAVGENWQQGKDSSTFPRLEVTGHLVKQLGRSYGKKADFLTGTDATEKELRSLPLNQYHYQVFATHGILDDEVPYIQEPALVLCQVGVDPKTHENDGFLTMTEVMDLKLNADVAALTACNTGVGKNLTGEGVMGMGRAFQYAGAKSVLMSLWSVEDESTNLLTEKFFGYLNQGKNKIDSLRLARTDIRKAGYEHPFFWAPFILVGEN